MKRTKPLARTAPMSRGTAQLKRTAFKKGKGRVGKLRAVGNRGARQHYFHEYPDPNAPGWATCQACGRPMHHTDCEAHHKEARGEELTNKQAMHPSCHKSFVHDPQQPRDADRKQIHRREARESPVDVTTGGTIAWSHETQARLDAFKRGIGGANDERQ